MRNFLKAFLVFLCWALIALFMNMSYDTDKNIVTKDDENLTKKIQENNSALSPTQVELKELPIEISSLETEKSEKKPEIVPLYFKHKFITNEQHTRVLFPRNFSYFKDSIFNFLNHNISKEIIIIGHYLPNEVLSNKTSFGKSRATYLKNMLIKYGVNPNKLIVKDTAVNYTYDNDGFYADGISIYFKDISLEKKEFLNQETKFKVIKNSLKRNNLKPDKELLTYTFELKDYMVANPDKIIKIIGHSKKRRTPERSYSIGLKLATQLMDYFVENGIPESKLKVISKGDTQPLDKKMSSSIKNRIEILIN